MDGPECSDLRVEDGGWRSHVIIKTKKKKKKRKSERKTKLIQYTLKLISY